MKHAGVTNYRMVIDQLVVILTGLGTDEVQREAEEVADVSIRYVTPTEIPLGHDQVMLEVHGIGFQLLSGILCSFDYEMESLLSHASIIDD